MDSLDLFFNQIFIKSKVDYKMFQNYFHQEKDEFAIHNSFNFSKGKYLISGFGLLNLLNDYKINFIQSNSKEKDILLGEDITSLSSSLGVISYPHFTYSFSKGLISNRITEDIFLLDIRVLPNSHGALVYNKKKIPICLVLPVLNVKYSYTPLIYALRLDKIYETLQLVYREKNDINKLPINFKPSNISEIKTDLIEEKFSKIKNSVFIIYTDKHYASCFYVGKGYFITNKHFFNNYESTKI
jgi:hypothetical protein